MTCSGSSLPLSRPSRKVSPSGRAPQRERQADDAAAAAAKAGDGSSRSADSESGTQAEPSGFTTRLVGCFWYLATTS